MESQRFFLKALGVNTGIDPAGNEVKQFIFGLFIEGEDGEDVQLVDEDDNGNRQPIVMISVPTTVKKSIVVPKLQIIQ